MSRDIQEYYRRITETDIGAVARELLTITHESGHTLECDCPVHKSQSRTSLRVNTDKQSWWCFGCQQGGDVLHLVEFVQSGVVTKGQAGPMPESHRKARDYLARKAGLPPLSQYGLSPQELARLEKARAIEDRTFQALTALADFYHQRMKANPDVLAWFREKYGIGEAMIDELKIGYADNEGLLKHLAGLGFSMRELAQTGAFIPTSTDRLMPFFRNRVSFPYWSRGRVVFMTSRKTPWTEENKFEVGKYKKLPVANDSNRKVVAGCIDNSSLFNEDILLSRPKEILITEGVTDCISLMEHGFPVVSPVTVQIREKDWERLIPKFRGVESVYICQDNEVSQVGFTGAMKTAEILGKEGIRTSIINLPLGERQQQARNRLREEFHLNLGSEGKALRQAIGQLPEDAQATVQDLLAEAKIDVNEYFAAGHTAEDFRALMTAAVSPVDFAIGAIPEDIPDAQLTQALEPVIEKISAQPEIEQERLLRNIQTRFNKRLSLTALRSQLKSQIKTNKEEARKAKAIQTQTITAPPGSCKAVIASARMESLANDSPIDYADIAERVYQWLTGHGGRLFRTSQGEPFMFYGKEVYWMDSPDRGKRRRYYGMMYELTGFVATMTSGKTFFDVLANLAIIRGRLLDQLSWIHTEVARNTVYFNLNNAEHQIAKITPDGVTLITNGGNQDQIILADSPKIMPIRFQPDARADDGDRILHDLIIKNMSCSPSEGILIVQWLSCFLLLDFAGTRPMTRFEGSSGSGKTTASKLISALLYGKPQQKKSTDAANYSDGARNPLLVLDNIESRQMSDELISFMLTSITGIAKEKRKSGSDTETVMEKANCLLNTTGIEPLGGELSEILSRSFVIHFDEKAQTNDCFLEARILASIAEQRDLILSVLMKRTSQVLSMIVSGAYDRVMKLLSLSLGSHRKRRCNDFLALMYLMTIADLPNDERNAALEKLDTNFASQIDQLNQSSQQTAREGNPIAAVLTNLFHAYNNAVRHDEQAVYGTDDRANHVARFIERYQIRFKSNHETDTLRGAELYAGLSRIAREFNMPFPYRDAGTLCVRIRNDESVILEAGFKVEREMDRKSKTNLYVIKLQE